MKYRKATILEQESATTAGTKTQDIDISDPISRIQVKFNSTNDGHDATDHFAKQVSKVAIVDGSEVLYSLSAQQIEALMFYEYGKGRNYELEYRNDCENRMVLDLLFGRHLWDPELALDPTRFKNPQIKVTHNKASGGSAPDAATLEIFADIFDEKKITPSGFIMNKEWYEWTTPSAAANEYIDLPNDYPIRRIGIVGYKADLWWDNIFSEIELDEENKKRLPWSLDAYDLMQLAITNYGQYHETLVGTGPSIATHTWFVTPTEVPAPMISVIGDPSNLYIGSETSGGYISCTVAAVSAFRAFIAGTIPHGMIPLDMGLMNVIDDWFDVTEKGKVKLRIKAGGTATAEIVLQQLRKYA